MGKLWISGIQKVETLNFWIFDPNCIILNNFCRNSSFTKSLGVIIASSRSGTCFSSCLASSIYFSITKKVSFLYGFMFFCVGTHQFHSLKSVSGPCSIGKVYPREWRVAIPASLMRVDKTRLYKRQTITISYQFLNIFDCEGGRAGGRLHHSSKHTLGRLHQQPN